MTLATPTETAAPAQHSPARAADLSSQHATPEADAPATAATAAVGAGPAAGGDRGWRPPTLLAESHEPLVAEGWTALDDLRWPGRWPSPLAHVLVGPGGVVVVDVDPRHWRLTADSSLRLGRRDATRECRETAGRAADVASLLHHEHRGAVHAFLCLTAQPLPAVEVEGGVTVTGVHGLGEALRTMPPLLGAADVQRISAHLQWQLSARGDRVEPADRAHLGTAHLGLVPAQRPASDEATAPPSRSAAQDEHLAAPAAVVTAFATRREALAAEREPSRRPR